jgi:hypothetical protein
MELSYAQNMEDYHLSLAFAGQKTGTYIDVGGGHPIADNVSFWFYERGWQGLVVEPQSELALLYKHLRPRDLVTQSAVGRNEGEIDFHLVERLHGFSTTVQRHAAKAQEFGASYRTVRMPIIHPRALERGSAHVRDWPCSRESEPSGLQIGARVGTWVLGQFTLYGPCPYRVVIEASASRLKLRRYR